MPRVHNLRRHRARELLELATRGPALDGPFVLGGNKKLQKEIQDLYRIWSESWLLPKLHDLVPELREQSQR